MYTTLSKVKPSNLWANNITSLGLTQIEVALADLPGTTNAELQRTQGNAFVQMRQIISSRNTF
jgi:hypothetical protein